MKIFKEIFARIWAFWGACVFFFTMLIALVFFLPCFWLKEPQRAKWHRAVAHVWMYFFLHAIGCPLTIENREVLNKDENYIITCNHNSLMDVPVTTPFMPRANKTIAKKSMASVPLFGWIYTWGSILVDRNDEKSRVKSFIDMRHVLLDLHLDMVLYPEGTRNLTDEPLKPFYNGAFRLAKDTGKKIVPAILFNSRKVLPADKPFYLMPHRLKLHFLPAMDPSNYSEKELKEIVFKKMWDYFVENKDK